MREIWIFLKKTHQHELLQFLANLVIPESVPIILVEINNFICIMWGYYTILNIDSIGTQSIFYTRFIQSCTDILLKT